MKLKKNVFFLFCILILAIIIYIMINISQDNMKNSMINRGQFAKAVALCLFTQEECDNSEQNYFEDGSSNWYNTYMNKLYYHEYLDINLFPATKESAETILTYKDFKNTIEKLNIDSEDINNIIKKYDETEEVKLADFVNIYDVMLKLLDKEKLISEEKIIITKINNDETGKPGIINTSIGDLYARGLDLSDCTDYEVNVYIKGNEIILMSKIVNKNITYTNAYIEKYENGILYVFANGAEREFKIKGIEESIKDSIADLEINNKKLTKLSLKNDKITGKVLAIDETGVEIETYAKLSFTEDFKVYKNYGNIEKQSTSNILVGYNTTEFVVANGKICAAIITKDIDAENIRVLIKTNNFASLFHNSVSITCEGRYIITYGEETQVCEAGQQTDFTAGSSYLSGGRVKIVPEDPEGKLIINSISRGYGTPSYRGSIEIASNENGLLVINELPLEEYLYSVIPSEMPVSYGIEALYVQAVCARSYAYKQLLKNSYSQYGAHVDDSISYQVYNNVEENELSINAVNETYGKICTYNGEVIEAFFFSTSAGSTTDATVWGNTDLPYIKGRLLTDDNTELDLCNNEVFDSFIRQTYDTYDCTFPWYRWNCTISLNDLTESINSNIAKRYSLNNNNILTLSSDGSYVSSNISSIGTLKKIEIAERGTGGIITKLILYGSNKTVLVKTESNIRNLINVYGIDINRCDGSVVNKNSTLPSAYFVLDDIVENGVLTGYKFVGGGFGHGVGVSQNAVKAMTEEGMKWQDILKYFYNGIELSDI